MLKLSNVKPIILGLESYEINSQEFDFFKNMNPAGFILFKRNISNKSQLARLCASLRELSGWNCPIFIDQEGGRVARLRSPEFNDYPAMDYYVNNPDQMDSKITLMAKELTECGIDVNCAPVLDLRYDYAHDIIGNRSFGGDPNYVALMAKKMAEIFIKNKIVPVIKHIPGHGRALCDSHEDLPMVDAKLEDLESTDFLPFKILNNMPIAMTAHIIYSCLDDKLPATLSKKVITYIRQNIGFKGLLISDDLSMKALTGGYESRAIKSLEAGCDMLLHCNGQMDEMLQFINLPNMKEDVLIKFRSMLEIRNN